MHVCDECDPVTMKTLCDFDNSIYFTTLCVFCVCFSLLCRVCVCVFSKPIARICLDFIFLFYFILVYLLNSQLHKIECQTVL